MKARNSSGSNSDSTDSANQSKVFKPRGPSEETEKCLSVSDVLGQVDAVLYRVPTVREKSGKNDFFQGQGKASLAS